MTQYKIVNLALNSSVSNMGVSSKKLSRFYSSASADVSVNVRFIAPTQNKLKMMSIPLFLLEHVDVNTLKQIINHD